MLTSGKGSQLYFASIKLKKKKIIKENFSTACCFIFFRYFSFCNGENKAEHEGKMPLKKVVCQRSELSGKWR